MAFSSGKSVEPMDDEEVSSAKGPPAAATKPKPATKKTSLFSTAGREINNESRSGLGGEGSSPQMIGMQGMARVTQGIQMLALAFPGIMPVLADLMGRLQTIVPQLVSDMSNGGTGLFPPGGLPPGQPPSPAPPMMAPPPGAGPSGPPVQ